MWHVGFAHLIERDRWGERCLFVSPVYWFQGFDKDPAFQHFVPLASNIAGELVHEIIARDREALWRLYEVSQRSRPYDTSNAYEAVHFLIRHIIGAEYITHRLPPPYVDHFCVLREQRPPPKRAPLLIRITGAYKPAPLAATGAWIAVECVDDSDAQRPLPGVQLELITASGDVRRERTNENGVALVTGIAPGRAVIRVLEVDGSRWSPLGGDASQPSTADERIKWHVVTQGECMSKIAHQHGLTSWRDVWEHPKNEALRKKRKSPHVLLPGDEVAVPRAKVYEIARETDATHRIELRVGTLVHVRVSLRDFNGVAFDNEAYELSVPGEHEVRKGVTDADGVVREGVPATASYADVRCPELGLGWRLELSTLDIADGGELISVPGTEERLMPEHSSITGLQARLNALGYSAGPVTGRWSEQTEAALTRFHADELGHEGEPSRAWEDRVDEALRRRVGA